MNIYLRKIYVLFVTQTFSVQENISQMRYIFSWKYNKSCKSYIIFQYKTFFHIKTFFSANNVYFVKIINIFSNKKFFFSA